MTNTNNVFIEVIVPVPVEGTFTYAVPSHLVPDVKVGTFVSCTFGKNLYYGVVHSFASAKPTIYEIKNISDVIYPNAFIPPSILLFWDWMAEYYMCSIGDVLKAAVPQSVIPSSKPHYSVVQGINGNSLTRNNKVVFELLQQKTLTETGLARQTGIKTVRTVLNRLVEKGFLHKIYPSVQYARSHSEVYLEIAPRFASQKAFKILLESLKASSAKRRALLAIFENQDDEGITKKQLKELFSVQSTTVKELIQCGFVTQEERVISYSPEAKDIDLAFLSIEQEKAYESITRQFKKTHTVLLHGVTSSGKTEVYFHLIYDAIKRGEQVLFLLPEITLTNNFVARVFKAFGDTVKVFHSKIAEKERALIWHGVVDKSVRIVVGVRSALFLPFPNLGLVIVDEEHENTYKQDDPAPRYNARDAAVMLAHLLKANVVLGSATPSVQTFYNAVEGKYGLVQLLKRHKEVEMPDIIVENLVDCYKKRKLKKHFSFTLIKAVEEALKKNEQVILFQNRRGYAPSVECKDCGYVHLCPDCNVTLTVHKTGHKMECHYCGFQQEIFFTCPECGSHKIIDRGMGTEKIEDEIKALFPGCRVARIDTDTAGKTQNVQQVFKQFDAGQLDILVGTQMISKGLDFSNVRVVGVLNADNLLNFPNYTSGERSFQLLTQVAGRAGRQHGNGKVIIQTHQPDHPVLLAVQNNNYTLFCENELDERKIFHYPPFYRITYINIKHADEALVELFSVQLAKNMEGFTGGEILGPEKPGVDKIKNFYYRRIILKTSKTISRKKLKEWLLYHVSFLKAQESFRTIQVLFDADPNG